MLKQLISLLSVGMLATAISAQSCSALTITGAGTPGTTLSINLDGPPAMGFALLAVGSTQGSTAINLGPLGTLNLDLEMPFLPLPLGMTDANGDVSRSFAIPASVSFPAVSLFGQGVITSFSMMPFGISFCTSDVVAFSVGV
ncbi:MAG TPA: hypothetical protein VFZ65_21550 [Planctomycetota bacterium]|nr:hypothetical protein [Planctomycetota bacterium]